MPLSFYVGRLDPGELGRDALVQVVWIVLLGLLLRAAWRRADQQVVVQGG